MLRGDRYMYRAGKFLHPAPFRHKTGFDPGPARPCARGGSCVGARAFVRARGDARQRSGKNEKMWT